MRRAILIVISASLFAQTRLPTAAKVQGVTLGDSREAVIKQLGVPRSNPPSKKEAKLVYDNIGEKFGLVRILLRNERVYEIQIMSDSFSEKDAVRLWGKGYQKLFVGHIPGDPEKIDSGKPCLLRTDTSDTTLLNYEKLHLAVQMYSSGGAEIFIKRKPYIAGWSRCPSGIEK